MVECDGGQNRSAANTKSRVFGSLGDVTLG